MANQNPGNVFSAANGITDNVALAEYCEQVRRLLHAGAVELSVTAAEVDARLRRVSGGFIVGGLTNRARARSVSKPIEQAGEALIIACQYMVTAHNRFEAAFMPELDAVGYQGRNRGNDFKFRAG